MIEKAVYKYQLSYNVNRDTIKMPYGAKIVKVALINNTIHIWALVRLSQKRETPRTFRLLGTGHVLLQAKDEVYTHLTTVFEDVYVWHIFEVSKK